MSKKKFDPTDTKQITDELDQSAFFRPQPLPQSAAPLNSAKAELQKSANAEMQKPINEGLQKSANAELQNSAKAETQNSVKAELQKAETQRAALRKTYDKTSYRLCPEAFEAIETAKGLLKRKYGLKASYEDIADIALILVREDLEKNGEQSELVKRLSAILQMQK